jgi:hypothetical protein
VWKEPAEGMLALGHLDERTGMKTFNLFNGETDEVPPGAPGHPGRAARVGSKLGAERLGMSVYEIPPGEAIGPYHFEWDRRGVADRPRRPADRPHARR